ncbi:aspartate-semialdehyde dehydrogenase [Phaeacidiphilus oryzae]|uniref:aspartate-semialdehyde dehydrogenase n=1 Tax=Phaeacidiphilus oryzae TaxID=348818 RepID=UPI000563E219|nr:Asd/ArgC dimerization domain-containing protein [Phaeacidiphilus oryzae]
MAGATGRIGSVLLELLSTRSDVWGEIRLAAAPEEHGRRLTVRGEETELRALDEDCFAGADIALFALPKPLAARWAPIAVGNGCVVVDSSGAFRMHPEVPLVVPEVNAATARLRPRGVVAGPRGTTPPLAVALGALHAEFGLAELVLATYQAASGAGESGVRRLRAQLSAVAVGQAAGQAPGTYPGDVRRAIGDLDEHGEPLRPEASGPEAAGAEAAGAEAPGADPDDAPLALNVVPWCGRTEEDGWSSEELGLREELRKILGLPELKATATCVRVPVVTGHSIAVHAVFAREVTVERAHRVLAEAPGVLVYDDPEQREFPTPVDVVGTDPAWVGRVRRSPDDPRALDFFLCADNLRKGGALNLVQIAEAVCAEPAAATEPAAPGRP